MRKYLVIMVSILFLFSSCEEKKEGDFTLHIIHTTDVHGNLFPYDFIDNREGEGGYARVAEYVQQLREKGEELILLDAGDILQGQPAAYYYNFIDTASVHLFAAALNFMEYDAIVVGNHDIETGHKVYDKWMKELQMPLLGANVIKKADNAEDEVPYFQPYVIFQKGGKRIALIGLTTPSLTNNLPEVLWSGMRFEDQVMTAKKIMPEVLAAEPDFIIAMIHSGIGDMRDEPEYLDEQIGWDLAQALPEVDLILMGHDHRKTLESYKHPDGKVTWLLNPANDARKISHTMVTFRPDGTLEVKPELVSMESVEPNKLFLTTFKAQRDAVDQFVNQPVGCLSEDMDARSSLFRPSTFVDLIHQLQFFIFPEAQISITAPLADNALMAKGELYMRDLFKLYRYENMLYLMELTGAEVKGLLEESYDRWIETMTKADDPLIKINPEKAGGRYLPTKNPTYNFDSASGISYTIDLSMPKDHRIEITKLGHQPFDLAKKYKVAINSYRGSGGGRLLTDGAGIPNEELKARILKSTDKDLRFYLIDFLKENNPYVPHVTADWHFIPTDWHQTAAAQDSLTLFANHPR